MRDPYFDIPAISNSRLSLFEKSPMHYKYLMEHPKPPTAAMLFGSLVHYVVLEPHMLKDYIIVFDETKRPEPDKDYKTKVNQIWRANFFTQADLEKKIAVSKEDFDFAQRIRDKLYTYPQSKEILNASGNLLEHGVRWKHGKSNCKGKIDIRNPYFLADLKTGADVDPPEFQKNIFNRKYHRQGGMYLDGDAEGKLDFANMKEFMFIAVETEEPIGISVHRLTRPVIERGYEEYCNLTEQLQVCIDTDIWQGYEYKADIEKDGIFDVHLPNYLRKAS